MIGYQQPLKNHVEITNSEINIVNLTDSPQTVFPVGTKIRVNYFLVSCGATDEIVIFRAITGAVEITRVSLHTREPVPIPGWMVAAASGLEVLTASPAGDVNVTAFYSLPGAPGL